MRITLIGIATLFCLMLAGCGGSDQPTINISERVSADVGAEANCDAEGLEEVAGQREELYTCSYQYAVTRRGEAHRQYVQVCVAWMNNDIYVVGEGSCT